MIDPMTGEGIHHAMEGGKIAAFFLDEVLSVGDFDDRVMAEYQSRWMQALDRILAGVCVCMNNYVHRAIL